MCVKGDQGSHWQHVDGVQRPVHSWFTYGPTETLHGDDVIPGEWWVGVPVKVDSICAVEQQPSTGGPSEGRSNNTGQYFGFQLLPNLDVLSLKGYCNWETSPDLSPPRPTA